MEDETNNRIEALESKVKLLTQKLNEVILCLEDNELSRKINVDYIYEEGMEETEVEKPEETTEEKPEEKKEETPEEKKEEATEKEDSKKD